MPSKKSTTEETEAVPKQQENGAGKKTKKVKTRGQFIKTGTLLRSLRQDCRVSANVVKILQKLGYDFSSDVVELARDFARISKRKTIKQQDVIAAFRVLGSKYGEEIMEFCVKAADKKCASYKAVMSEKFAAAKLKKAEKQSEAE